MQANPTFTRPNRVTCIPGYATATTCKLLVVTLNDPASNPVTVTVNGSTYTAALTARGSPTVCWTGTVTVTGLSEFTRYTWSVAQGVNSDSGSLMTTPGWRDDWMFVFASCDNATHNSSDIALAAGAWYDIERRIAASAYPCAGMLFVDDLGYVDTKQITDAATGLSNGVPQTTLALNDYLVAWCCYLGMLGPDTTAGPSDSTDVNERRIWYPRETSRAWCRKNINWWPQWGDHEFANDQGWDNDAPVSTAGSNARWTTYATVDGPGKTAWDTFMGQIQPPRTNMTRDTLANHWVMRVGCVTFACPDAITRSDSAIIEATPYPTTAITTMYGTNQIDDMLAAINTEAGAFTVLGMGNSLRYPTSNYATLSEYNSGAQHPIYDHCLGEYQRLFTRTNYGADPASLMANKRTNGVAGTLISLHGDYHRAHAYKMKAPSAANIAAEEFYAIGVGTVGGTTNMPVQDTNAASIVGATAANVEVAAAGVANEYNGVATFWNMVCTVRGSQYPEDLHVRVGNYQDAEVCNYRFLSGCGNLPVPESYTAPMPAIIETL